MQSLHQQLIALLSDASYRADVVEGRILGADEGLVRLLGLDCTPDALVGRRLEDLGIAYLQQDGAPSALRPDMELSRRELHCRTPSGEDRRLVEYSYITVAPESGQRVLEAVLRDVTKRVQAEEAQRATEDLLEATLESTADGILVVDDEGRVLYANRRFADMWRIPDELLATRDDRRLLEFVLSQLADPEAFISKVQELYQSAADSSDVLSFRDGRVFARFSRPLMRNGRLSGRVWSFTDITDRHRAEQQLRLDEARLKALVQLSEMTEASLHELTDFAMEAGVSLTGSTIGYLAFMNEDETVLTMHAWSKTAMAECAISDKPIVYPVETTGLWGEAVRQRQPVITNDYEAPNPAKKGYPEGHVRVKRHMNVPVFDGDRIVAVAGVGNKPEPYDETDVAQLRLLMDAMWRLIHRRKAAEALQRAHDELERRVEERTAELARSNAELEQFAYVASHDLQEPLRKIVAFGDRLEDTCGECLSEEGRDYLHRMQNAARRMQELINDLLAYSRLTTRARPFTQVDLGKVTREVLGDLEETIRAVQGTVEVGDLPTIEADPTQMRQLIQNLIANGLKFHKPGEPPVVRVHGRVVEGAPDDAGDGRVATVWEIVVEDSGIGFEPRHADRIFGVFQRLHGRGEYEGTGVGLAVCRKIVERHHGRIAATSTPGRGARFVITLPAAQAAAGDKR